jgi:hypothetical protein
MSQATYVKYQSNSNRMGNLKETTCGISNDKKFTMKLDNNWSKLLLIILAVQIIVSQLFICTEAKPTVLLRVCDAKQVKTVTNRVCMLYKRTKNSNVKRDKQGNLRISKRQTKAEYSPTKLASDCCKIGCPPHIFASIC